MSPPVTPQNQSHAGVAGLLSDCSAPLGCRTNYPRLDVLFAIAKSEFWISMSRVDQSRTNSRSVDSSRSAVDSASPKLSNVDICWETVQSFAPCRGSLSRRLSIQTTDPCVNQAEASASACLRLSPAFPAFLPQPAANFASLVSPGVSFEKALSRPPPRSRAEQCL